MQLLVLPYPVFLFFVVGSRMALEVMIPLAKSTCHAADGPGSAVNSNFFERQSITAQVQLHQGINPIRRPLQKKRQLAPQFRAAR